MFSNVCTRLGASAFLRRTVIAPGPAIGPSLVTGFGKYPTYATLDLGYASHAAGGLVGWAAMAGPVVRIDPTSGWGFGLRAAGDVLFFQLGARLLVIAASESGPEEAQVTFTLGGGRF